LSLIVLALAPAMAHAGMVRGRVSIGDAPVAGAVVVWEDRVFTQTAADGTYRLEAPGAGIVWVRAPEGASPAPVWRTVGDRGEVDVDLVLAPMPPPALPLRFVHVSDLHVGGVDGEGVRAALAQAIGTGPPPAFVVATGDLSQASQPAELRRVRALAAALPVPFVPGLGNHDWLDGGASYRAIMGPPAYSFDAGGAHFIMLHGNAPVPERLAFVAKDLAFVAPGTPVFAFIHYPITLPYDQQLYDGLVAAGVKHIFTGHYHANRTIDFPGLTDHNVQPLAMGGLELVPAGYEVVTIEDGVPHTTPGFVVDRPIAEVMAPADGGCVPPGDVSIVVAAAIGAGAPDVRASIDGAAPIALAAAGGWDYAATAAIDAPGDHVVTAQITQGGVTRSASSSFCVRDAAGAPPAALEGGWPQLGGSARHANAVDFDVAPAVHAAWTAHVGGFVLGGSPVLDRGRLFVPVADFGTEAHGGLVALDAATGATLWEARIGSVVSAPAIDEGLVIVAAVDGVLRAYHAESGQLAWSYDLGAGLPPQSRGLYASPMVADGVVYAGQMYHFAALDALTGAPLWETHPSDAQFVDLTQSTPAADDDRVVGVFGRGADGVRAWDSTDGAPLWTDADELVRGMTAPPTLDGPVGYFASSAGTLFSADLTSGEVGWRDPLVPGGNEYSRWTRAAPAEAAGRVFVSTQPESVFAASTSDGKVAWHASGSPGLVRAVSYSDASRGFSTSPVVTAGRVWIAGDDGVVRALDAGTGALEASIALGAPVLSGVIPARTVDGDGVLFVASFDGTVRALTSAPGDGGSTPPDGCTCAAGSRSPAPPLGPLALLVLGAIIRRTVCR
jgi:MYXO-CTERM domain-containing protein